MAGWVTRQFKGVAPRLAPQLLAENQAQTCINAWLRRGSLAPRKLNAAVTTLPKAGTMKTIHRFGQSVAADDQFWFHWAADVNVARGFVAGDVQERTYWTGDGIPKVTDAGIATTGGTSYPMASYTLGIPAPTLAPAATVGGTPTSASALAEDRVYIVTFVSTWAEEGAPSDASNQVTVQVGETVSLALPTIPGGAYSFASKRIYRSVPGSLGTPYLFVAEVSAATTVYVDSTLADALGEELASLDYEMPPAGLSGMVAGPNGTMGGFVGKDIYFCEPWKPHAWPSKYILTVDADVVALAVFDTTWLVLTKGRPYLISGAHPDSYSMVRSELDQSCAAKRSVAAADGGVAYASPDGLFLVGGGGTRNLTEAIYSRREWQALDMTTLHGSIVDNQYVGFVGSGGFVLDLQTGDWVNLDFYASAAYYDPIRDALFLVTGGNSLVKFDASASNASMTWRSKAFYSPKAISLGAARVEAATYPVTFTYYADGKPKHTQKVDSGEAFRLPSGFLANQFEYEVSGAFEILSAGFAEAVQELSGG